MSGSSSGSTTRMTPADRSRAERARKLASSTYRSKKAELEALGDALAAYQSTDDPGLVPEHDRLMRRYLKLEKEVTMPKPKPKRKAVAKSMAKRKAERKVEVASTPRPWSEKRIRKFQEQRQMRQAWCRHRHLGCSNRPGGFCSEQIPMAPAGSR